MAANAVRIKTRFAKRFKAIHKRLWPKNVKWIIIYQKAAFDVLGKIKTNINIGRFLEDFSRNMYGKDINDLQRDWADNQFDIFMEH